MNISLRLRLIISAALSNFYVVLITIVQQVSLENVARVYWAQCLIVFVLTIFKILSANHLSDEQRAQIDQSFIAAKIAILGMCVTMGGLFLLLYFLAFYIWSPTELLWIDTLILVAKCCIIFLINNLILFKNERENGFHKQLLSDQELMRFVFRMQLIFIPIILFLSGKINFGIDYSFNHFAIALLIIAIVDSAIQIIRVEEFEMKLIKMSTLENEGRALPAKNPKN